MLKGADNVNHIAKQVPNKRILMREAQAHCSSMMKSSSEHVSVFSILLLLIFILSFVLYLNWIYNLIIF